MFQFPQRYEDLLIKILTWKDLKFKQEIHNPPNTSNRASEIGSKNWEFKNLRVNFCLIVAKGEKKMLWKIRRFRKNQDSALFFCKSQRKTIYNVYFTVMVNGSSIAMFFCVYPWSQCTNFPDLIKFWLKLIKSTIIRSLTHWISDVMTQWPQEQCTSTGSTWCNHLKTSHAGYVFASHSVTKF